MCQETFSSYSKRPGPKYTEIYIPYNSIHLFCLISIEKKSNKDIKSPKIQRLFLIFPVSMTIRFNIVYII